MTSVALVAVTVNVDELFKLIEVGLAVILTMGATALKWFPHPVIRKSIGNKIAAPETTRLNNLHIYTFIAASRSLLLLGAKHFIR